jgi:hypothetical protein
MKVTNVTNVTIVTNVTNECEKYQSMSHAARPQKGTYLHAAGASGSSSPIRYACQHENTTQEDH